jgi:TrmH family RNA methyltransferase
MIKRIESSENPFIKKIASLKNKKYRDKENLFITEGIKICEDILMDSKKNKYIQYLILTESNESLLTREPFISVIDKTIVIKEKHVKEITDTVTSQGVFLLLQKEKLDINERISNYSRILILDGVADPGNMGTLIRTALAAKFDAIISLKGSVDIYNPKVVRSTMGAITKIDIFDSHDPNEIISLLKTSGFIVFAADLKGEKTIYDIFPEEKAALVMGSEANGISLPKEYFDMKITVPMNEESESLNVSVAGGLLMYAINKSKFEK